MDRAISSSTKTKARFDRLLQGPAWITVAGTHASGALFPITQRRRRFIRGLSAVAAVTWPIVVTIALNWPASAQTPSFDCAIAAAPVEHLICADATLATRDSEMAQAFRLARKLERSGAERSASGPAAMAPQPADGSRDPSTR